MNLLVTYLQKLSPLVLVSLSACSVVIGDLFAKYWSLNLRNSFYVLAIIFYMGSAILYIPYIPSLLKEGLVITALLWTLLTTIGFLFIGIVMFKEHLSPMQIIGSVLGVISLIILSFGR